MKTSETGKQRVFALDWRLLQRWREEIPARHTQPPRPSILNRISQVSSLLSPSLSVWSWGNHLTAFASVSSSVKLGIIINFRRHGKCEMWEAPRRHKYKLRSTLYRGWLVFLHQSCSTFTESAVASEQSGSVLGVLLSGLVSLGLPDLKSSNAK